MNGVSLKTETLVLLVAAIITLSTVVVVQWLTARADEQDKLDAIEFNIATIHQKQAGIAEQIEEMLAYRHKIHRIPADTLMVADSSDRKLRPEERIW